jgi:chitinase
MNNESLLIILLLYSTNNQPRTTPREKEKSKQGTRLSQTLFRTLLQSGFNRIQSIPMHSIMLMRSHVGFPMSQNNQPNNILLSFHPIHPLIHYIYTPGGFETNILVMFLLWSLPVLCVALCRLQSSLGQQGSSLLPDNLVVGYASWNECDDKIITAVEEGVNVVIWFAINLAVNESSGLPVITGGPDLQCVQHVKSLLQERNLPTTHLISIGGWDAPHPDTTNPTPLVFAAWVAWSNGLFDGFDWDIEGNDELDNPNNIITYACMELMGEMSQLGKQAGYVVSMAPAESYMDPTTSAFDEELLHSYPEWEELQPNFHYHGLNPYAYIYQKYGVLAGGGNTFDFVSIQLYEGYSHALYNITMSGVDPSAYLQQYVSSVLGGWFIDTELATGTGNKSDAFVKIPSSQLVIGLANGWADNSKFLLVWPESLASGYEALRQQGQQPRGFMFWDIADEGLTAVDSAGVERPFWMARGLNSLMHTRD